MWAISALLFKRLSDFYSATALNFSKGMVALLCFALIVDYNRLSQTNMTIWLMLGLSGVFGICLADTLYFKTLTKLGPRLTLLFDPLIPLLTAVAGILLLSEQMQLLSWFSLSLTVTSVTVVLWHATATGTSPSKHWLGVVFGVGFVLLNVAGIILIKFAANKLSALDTSFIRQVAALLCLTFWGTLTRQWPKWSLPLRSTRHLLLLIMASLIGAFLGSWLSMLGLQYTHAAVATTLNATAPIFVIIILALLYKEKTSIIALFGTLTAIFGVMLYFYSIN